MTAMSTSALHSPIPGPILLWARCVWRDPLLPLRLHGALDLLVPLLPQTIWSGVPAPGAQPSLLRENFRFNWVVLLIDGQSDREWQRHLVPVAISNSGCLSDRLTADLLRRHVHRVCSCWSCDGSGSRSKLLCAAAADGGHDPAAEKKTNQRRETPLQQLPFAEGEAQQTEPEHCCECGFALAATQTRNVVGNIGIDGHDHRSRPIASLCFRTRSRSRDDGPSGRTDID